MKIKKQLYLLFLSALLFACLYCTNKKSESPLPKPAGANLRAGLVMDSVCGNYCNEYNPGSNVNNAFCIRFFPCEPPRPLIITFHGGSYVSGDKSQFKMPLTIGNRFPVLLKTEHLDNNKFAYASANYRLLDNPDDPSDDYDLSKDSLTIKSCLNDCKAFVEYMRDNATEYNIDPNKIILMGYSGGAGASLWIGLQNNLIPGVTIKGIVAFDAQATMNILEWRDQVFVPAGASSVYDAAFPNISDLIPTAKLYYGTAIPNKVNAYAALHKLSYFSLFDSADPELYMACQASYSDPIHHPAHDAALFSRSNAAGHVSKIQYVKYPYPSVTQPTPYINPNFESLIQFCIRKFQ